MLEETTKKDSYLEQLLLHGKEDVAVKEVYKTVTKFLKDYNTDAMFRADIATVQDMYLRSSFYLSVDACEQKEQAELYARIIVSRERKSATQQQQAGSNDYEFGGFV
jgi:hypothetical protein